MTFRLGIDMGGTSVKMGLVSPSHKIVKETSVESGAGTSVATLVEKIGAQARLMLGTKKVSHIGVGVAGDIDFEKGVIRVSPNLGWRNVPLRKLLEKEFKRSVLVDNDANVAAWGVYKTQVSAKHKHVIVLTLGTGVGGGVIVDGHIHRGATGSAGEVGHMIVEENGRLCHCGNKGCLEAYVGGPYLMRHVKDALTNGVDSRLCQQTEVTPKDIAAAAHAGDVFAQTVWRDVGQKLGLACGNLIYIFNPSFIYLCGGIAQANELILNPIRSHLKTRAFRTPMEYAHVKVAQNSSHIGLVGASLL